MQAKASVSLLSSSPSGRINLVPLDILRLAVMIGAFTEEISMLDRKESSVPDGIH